MRDRVVSHQRETKVRFLGLAFVAFLVSLLLPVIAAQGAADDTLLVSRADGVTGNGGDGDSYTRIAMSADGRYVTFVSDADNLTLEANPAVSNVFVRDMELGTTTLVSRATGLGGVAADGYSASPSISPGGRHVAFKSKADNLSAEDNDSVTNIFVRDLEAGTTTLVSRASGADGAVADATSSSPSVSQDGRFVAFKSAADNLSPDANGAFWNVFVRDTQLGTTTLVSRGNGVRGAPEGPSADGDSSAPTITANGLRVAFESTADNLSSKDDDAVTNVYLRDLVDKSTTLATCTSGEGFLVPCPSGADGDSSRPVISTDGRYVAFESVADNLSDADDNAYKNIFVRDVQGNITTLASRATGAAGTGASADSVAPSLSGDGRFVAFASAAENLSDQDVATFDVFVRDTGNNVTGLGSRATGYTGPAASGSSFGSAVSGNGLFLAFASEADNLGAEDNDIVTNVFRRDISSFGAPPPPPPLELPPCHHGACDVPADHSGTSHASAGHAAGGHPAGASGGHSGHTVKRGRGPGQTVVARRTQDVDKLFIVAVIHQNGKIDVTGTVRLPGASATLYRFKPVTRKMPAHLLKRIRLRLPGKALRSVKRVLRTGKGVNARLSVKAWNAAGNSSTVKRVVRLRP